MKKYLQIYITLIKMNFSRLVIYRGNLVSNIISSLAWGSFLVIQIMLVTSRTNSIYGWSRNELLLLAGSFNLIVGLFHIFFSRSFARFSVIIDKGDLDFFLLKPVDPQFLLSFHTLNIASILRVLFGIFFNVYLVMQMGLRVSWLDIVSYCIFIFTGVIILYSIWFTVTTLIIWFTRLSNLVELLYTLNGVARLPPDFINEVKNIFVLLLLPLTFVVATPTEFLVHRVSEWNVIRTIFTAIFLFGFSRWFWKRSLKYYTSASS